ncbi:MAG: DUF3267 domain-containing protein [Oscillospiraceae bacterium]|nr:DUF3267 domain-containing protein [Oscillospiraceae bacterium]
MKSFKIVGRFKDESQLDTREHPEGAVAFREPKSAKALSLIGSLISVLLIFAVWLLITAVHSDFKFSIAGFLLAYALMVPHEFLHALCFQGDVKMYHALTKGMLFVHGTEDMTKLRFVMMSLCPNIAFGFVPLILYFIFPQLHILGTLGLMSVAFGAGDYINIFNALTQMPKGALTYLSGFHSYWYIPKA